MNLLECLNEKIQIIGGTPFDGGEDIVRELAETSPILLPEDYIDFLKMISGNTDDGNVGLELGIKIKDNIYSMQIYSAQQALKMRPEYEEIYSYTDSNGIIDQIWLIGNDLGDLYYFYGQGKEGFGLYVAEDSAIYFENADKIADTLTDFLVKGIGFNTAFWLHYS